MTDTGTDTETKGVARALKFISNIIYPNPMSIQINLISQLVEIIKVPLTARYMFDRIQGVIYDGRMWWQPIGQSINNIRQPHRKARGPSYLTIKLKASTNFIESIFKNHLYSKLVKLKILKYFVKFMLSSNTFL